jgi:serine/threonine protein kinase
MTTALTLLKVGFSSRTGEQVGPPDVDFGLSTCEMIPPTICGDETPPSHKLAERTAAKGWPTLPGYEILAELGRGGMAFVYKARDLRRERLVAIKITHPGLASDGDLVARFRQEQRLAVRLAHPNMVAAYDAGQVEGFLYLVLEFVEGHDLAWIIKQRGQLPAAEACEVIRRAALGLEHLHKHGLVHRDIKPANLMLTESRQVKLLDLGLARPLCVPAAGELITFHGQFLGTPDYMAPEQCLDSHGVDARADIYALGCTLYELLTGQPPFAGPDHGSVFQKMKAHVEAPVPPIRGHRADVPERLAAALERMLAKDRAGRFVSAAAVVAALQPFAAGADLEGLSLAPPSSTVVAA